MTAGWTRYMLVVSCPPCPPREERSDDREALLERAARLAAEHAASGGDLAIHITVFRMDGDLAEAVIAHHASPPAARTAHP